MSLKTTIVIPCFNEAERFQEAEADTLINVDNLHLLLVNDGSTDQTAEQLDRYALSSPNSISVLHLGQNRGKAEAVRQGLNRALEDGADIVGFLDGDFATPAIEMLKLVEKIRTSDGIHVLLGSRWMHLGADIKREPLRHYGGRVFATLASQVLKLQVYDTQCGAKLFRSSEVLTNALSQPFESSWAFDVELIGRLRQGTPVANFYELPLARWINVAGSKITLKDMLLATFSLFKIRGALKRFEHYSK